MAANNTYAKGYAQGYGQAQAQLGARVQGETPQLPKYVPSPAPFAFFPAFIAQKPETLVIKANPHGRTAATISAPSTAGPSSTSSEAILSASHTGAVSATPTAPPSSPSNANRAFSDQQSTTRSRLPRQGRGCLNASSTRGQWAKNVVDTSSTPSTDSRRHSSYRSTSSRIRPRLPTRRLVR